MNFNLKREMKRASRFHISLVINNLKYGLGMWLDLDLSGTRPKPLHGAAMASIDQHRALLHGMDMKNECHSLLISLNQKV